MPRTVLKPFLGLDSSVGKVLDPQTGSELIPRACVKDPGVVVQTCSPTTEEAELGRFLRLTGQLTYPTWLTTGQ